MDLLFGVMGAPRTQCKCCVDHNPEPVGLERHHIHPLAWGGPKDGETAPVCRNTHGNVHILHRAAQRHGSWPPPYDLLRRFSRFTRDLAADGWRRAHEGGIDPVTLPLYAVTFALGGTTVTQAFYPCARHEAEVSAVAARAPDAVEMAPPGAVCRWCTEEVDKARLERS